MKYMLYIIVFIVNTTLSTFAKEKQLNPLNHPANERLLRTETYIMDWLMLTDTSEVKIGEVETQIQKKDAVIYLITKVKMNQSSDKWVDSTVVSSENFKPIYHASYNKQRDMVLKFDKNVTGYYLDKQTGLKTEILEETYQPFFDSNFYPQLIRLLPLKENYSATISIFDYNPKSKIGAITATIKNTKKTNEIFNDVSIDVWKIEVMDDISDNNTWNTYYIDARTRKLLKQEIDFGGRKMIMRLIE
ncbi:DUF3108 domain-containing protein [Mangrovimonas futianensis]|uniref:DUF3108 domain-containing protein n=1 Tax=Mangrovimonas futianensis TaxID=2895523 RepID=UPI001E310B87|nr:hypothetical protein [Mangrovimonas futianensis]MCF1422946.1 hypothetical protein [Mangrovimonas futianensis]